MTKIPFGRWVDRRQTGRMHQWARLGLSAETPRTAVCFALSVGAGGYVALRGLQGIGAGAVQVAGLALVGVVVPAAGRGRAFAVVFAAQLAGMALGPLAGSAAGVENLHWLFIATAVVSMSAAIPVWLGTPRTHVDALDQRSAPLVLTQQLF